jgi:hypothetical protein
MDTSVFWGKSPRVLLQHTDQFIPRKGMTRDQSLNALTRLLIYVTLLLTAIQSSLVPIYAACFLVIVMYVYRMYPSSLSRSDPSSSSSRFEPRPRYVAPTRANPFMNHLPFTKEPELTETMLNQQDVSYASVQDRVENKFYEGIFQDFSDVYGNSQRQFYTMPNTALVNQQDKFAKWLYGAPKEGVV